MVLALEGHQSNEIMKVKWTKFQKDSGMQRKILYETQTNVHKVHGSHRGIQLIFLDGGHLYFKVVTYILKDF